MAPLTENLETEEVSLGPPNLLGNGTVWVRDGGFTVGGATIVHPVSVQWIGSPVRGIQLQKQLGF
jgi:hypothetical protein